MPLGKNEARKCKIKLSAKRLVQCLILLAVVMLAAAVIVFPTFDPPKSNDPPVQNPPAKNEESTSTKKTEAAARPNAKKTTFPSPAELAGPDATVLLEPTFGHHRPEKDAVFAFAEGYSLPVYALFITSLRDTGFEGDIVLSVSSPEKLAANVEDFLRHHSKKGVVVYTVDWQCWKKGGEMIVKKGMTTTNNGFSDCKMGGFYGDAEGKPLDDPRMARPVATARYELYWAWSLTYQPKSKILLIDVRDTFFQRDPFGDLARTPDNDRGVLHLYEENSGPDSAAANIGKSTYNSGWIRAAYGPKALKSVRDEPVICSGSSIGDQIALETYLRAMVKQFDDTKCKRVGCDQGLHNYLYYSGKLLEGASEIDIKVYKQGEGSVNNLAAMRNSPLRDQGVLEKQNGIDVVVNSDKTVSNVAHQFDRDEELKRILKRRTDDMISKLDFKAMKNS